MWRITGPRKTIRGVEKNKNILDSGRRKYNRTYKSIETKMLQPRETLNTGGVDGKVMNGDRTGTDQEENLKKDKKSGPDSCVNIVNQKLEKDGRE